MTSIQNRTIPKLETTWKGTMTYLQQTNKTPQTAITKRRIL